MGNADNEPSKGTASAREPDGAVARIGTVVDKYTIVRMLGRGGMGAVYEARHAMLARRIAMKFLLPELAANREILRRFENEARAAGGLEHPNLAAVNDFGRADDGSPYLVMEFLPGEDCAKLLRRLGPLSVSRAANIVVQACRGLSVAHAASIVHRDLKPENLFVTDAGDGSDLVKVLDFGIAKLRVNDTSVITGTGATFGTAFYMSPEQARGAGDVDPRTDVWSLGVVLYELLSGRRPFLGEQFLHVIHQILSVEPPPLATLRPDLPPALVAAIEAAMRKDLGRRLPSVVALAEALAPFAGTRVTDERRPATAPFAPTAATPGTHAGESLKALSRGAPVSKGASAKDASGVDVPAARGGLGIKVALAVGFVVVLASVVVFVLGRPSPERAAFQPTAQPVVPSSAAIPPPSVPSPPAPAVLPREAPDTTTSLPPTESSATSPHVRTLFKPVPAPSNRRATPGDPRPHRVPARTVAPPNAPAPLEKPTPSHRLEIDKDDPFAGP